MRSNDISMCSPYNAGVWSKITCIHLVMLLFTMIYLKMGKMIKKNDLLQLLLPNGSIVHITYIPKGDPKDEWLIQ